MANRTKALEKLKALPTKLYVDGEWVDSSSPDTKFDAFDPRTGAIIASVTGATEADVDSAVAAAREAVRDTQNTFTAADTWSMRGAVSDKVAPAQIVMLNVTAPLAVDNVGFGRQFCCSRDYVLT